MESPKPQYQHFVPQFLLRNFSHPYKPAGGKKKGKRKDDNGLYYGESVVRAVDLATDLPVICEKPIKRILGQINMYDDSTKPSKEQRRLEELLGKFESQAAKVFSKILKAYANHQGKMQENPETTGGVCLTRSERDCIRKFLFILKYRGLDFHQRFNHETVATYDSNDNEHVREYMSEKLYDRPLNVWLDNIKAIIDADRDTELGWGNDLPRRMYPDDAMWFFSHAQTYFMSICTPADPTDEFVLTDNSYNVFEGPNTFMRSKDTGDVEGSAHAPLHMFAPVSPKLMIVLRCYLLPSPLEDADDAVRKDREKLRKISLDSVYGGGVLDKGLLGDLPVAKAQNSYSTVVNGRLALLPGYDGKKRKDDRFFFNFFRISSRHVNTINSILLDNLGPSTSVVFETTATFARTLEWYLTAPCSLGKTIVRGMKGDQKEESLRKLEIISRSLGSTKKTVSSTLHVPLQDLGHEAIHEQWKATRWMWKKLVVDQDEAFKGYIKEMESPECQHLMSYFTLGMSSTCVSWFG